MKFTNNSDSTVRRATRDLEAIGLIKKVQRLNSSNIYIIKDYVCKDVKDTTPVCETVPITETAPPVIMTVPPCFSDMGYISDRPPIRLDYEINDYITYTKEQEENEQASVEESKDEMNLPLSFSSESQKLSDSTSAPAVQDEVADKVNEIIKDFPTYAAAPEYVRDKLYRDGSFLAQTGKLNRLYTLSEFKGAPF